MYSPVEVGLENVRFDIFRGQIYISLGLVEIVVSCMHHPALKSRPVPRLVFVFPNLA